MSHLIEGCVGISEGLKDLAKALRLETRPTSRDWKIALALDDIAEGVLGLCRHTVTSKDEVKLCAMQNCDTPVTVIGTDYCNFHRDQMGTAKRSSEQKARIEEEALKALSKKAVDPVAVDKTKDGVVVIRNVNKVQRSYKIKPCAVCEQDFQPTGSRARYCQKCVLSGAAELHKFKCKREKLCQT